MVASECLTPEILGGYAAGTLAAVDAQTVDGHLSQCETCLSRLDVLARQADPLVSALRGVSASSPQPTALAAAVAAVLSGANGREPKVEVSPAVGTLVGGYRIVGELGRGGMGRVYRAVHPRLDQELALKLIRPGMDSTPILARFEAERQALALMDHPHIARVSDGGVTEDGQPFFVMELVRGVPITRYCQEHGLGLRRILELFIDVCQAVQHAHQKGIIHRDLKPSNILVAEYDGDATPKVIDFGVARAIERRTGAETEIGMLVGTPDYMSPEQADLTSTDIDTRSDIYSLGALLYELLTGSAPLARSAETPILERLRVIREEEPPAPSRKRTPHSALGDSHGKELDWIVLKALEKDRTLRYQTAVALAEDVRRYLSDEPVEAGPPSKAYRIRKFVRRNRAALAVAAGFAVVLILATAVSSALAWRANNERIRAESAEGKERDARTTAETRLGQIEKVNTILASVFRDINPRLSGTYDDESLRVLLGKRLEAAAAQVDEAAIGDPDTVAILQERLGMTQLSLGYTDKALALLTMAADARERLLGPDHEETLMSRMMVTRALSAAGRVNEAIAILEDAIRRYEGRPAKDSGLFTAMHNLSGAYDDAGRTREAIELGERTLQLRTVALGPGHRNTLLTRKILASAYQAAGETAKAIQLVEENLSHYEAGLGPEHPDTIASREGPASLYAFAQRAADAASVYEEILAFRIKTFGPEHPRTLTTRANLGEAYRDLKRTAEALAMHEETHRLRKRILGPLHPSTLNSRDNLGEAYVDSKRLDEAIAMHEETLRLRTSTLGADHPDTLVSSDHLAIAYHRAGRADDAIRQQEETLARRKATLGEDHPDAQRSAGNLANAYRSDKRYQDAERVYHELIASRSRTLPADDIVLADTRVNFGIVLTFLKKSSEAESLLREALAVREKKEPRAWKTANLRANLGQILLNRRKLAAAEPFFLEAYEAMQPLLGTDSAARKSRVSEVASRLVRIYEGLKKPEEAAKWREKPSPGSGETADKAAPEEPR